MSDDIRKHGKKQLRIDSAQRWLYRSMPL